MQHKGGKQLLDSLPEEARENVICLGVDAKNPVSDAEYTYAPLIGLKAALSAADEGNEILIIFDDVLLH